MIISKAEELKKIEDNSFEGELPTIIDSTIEFKGKGNILYCDEGVTLENTRIAFQGNNSVVYLSKSRHPYQLNVSINNNSTLYFGKDNYINQTLLMVLSEEKNIFVGNECIFSTGIVFRNADAHLIYDNKTHSRLNYTKSIYLGDHIWLGQNTMIFKGTQIDSGSIIGALSLLSGKKINHNTSNAGIPVKELKKKIFWTRDCVHSYTSKETEAKRVNPSKEYIYHYNEDQSIAFMDIEKTLATSSPDARIKYLQKISKNTDKNRFVHLIGHVKLKKAIIKLKKIVRKVIKKR